MTLGAAKTIEKRFDAIRFRLKRRFGLLDPFEILPYRGHGTPRELFLKGRILEKAGISRAVHDDTVWQNVRNMARRFASDEVAGARVRASFRRLSVETKADVEGFFEVTFRLPEPLDGKAGWYPVELELLSPSSPGGGPVHATGEVLVPQGARFGVISDLDDTVVRSSATNVLKMAWIVLRNNAHTRLPFEGVATFYRALQLGVDGGSFNPIIYVSSSPWNIYDVLEDFMDVHGVPHGPLFLKDWSPTVLGKHKDYKIGVIRRLLETYEDLPFVLIGDSGEEDPEIYLQTIREYPGRILAVYIRDVTSGGRDAEVANLAEEARSLGTDMVAVQDSAVAAEHASSIGLIAPDAVAGVRAESSARS
ncbi:MAG TPA: phosphatase domain-containing protein [Rubrobacter sp.]